MAVSVDRVLVASIAVLVPLGSGSANAQSQQEHVHHMAHEVMPFDVSKTLHVFMMTESGGVQRVVAKDPNDSQQIALVQQHLSFEAGRFQRGDFSAPEALHGEDMPGLKEMRLNARKIKISYAPRTDGGEIVFETNDPHALTGIHRWFGAQLSEHGADAKAQ